MKCRYQNRFTIYDGMMSDVGAVIGHSVAVATKKTLGGGGDHMFRKL